MCASIPLTLCALSGGDESEGHQPPVGLRRKDEGTWKKRKWRSSATLSPISPISSPIVLGQFQRQTPNSQFHSICLHTIKSTRISQPPPDVVLAILSSVFLPSFVLGIFHSPSPANFVISNPSLPQWIIAEPAKKTFRTLPPNSESEVSKRKHKHKHQPSNPFALPPATPHTRKWRVSSSSRCTAKCATLWNLPSRFVPANGLVVVHCQVGERRGGEYLIMECPTSQEVHVSKTLGSRIPQVTANVTIVTSAS